MKNHEDLDFLNKKIEEENVQAPESLSKEAMLKMLDSAPEEAQAEIVPIEQKRPKKRVRTFLTAAAAFAVIVASVSIGVSRFGKSETVVSPTQQTSARTAGASTSTTAGTSAAGAEYDVKTFGASDALLSFESYDELSKLYKENHEPANGYGYVRNGVALTAAPVQEAAADGVVDFSTAKASAAPSFETAQDVSASFSETYAQVEGIDEADIIKTDGKNIYSLSREQNRVRVFSAEGKNSALIGTIDYDRLNRTGKNTVESYITLNDMYLYDGKLIVIGCETKYSYPEDTTDAASEDKNESGETGKSTTVPPPVYYDFYYRGTGESVTFADIYDISDPKAPRKIDSAGQSGECCASRLTDGKLYFVTTQREYGDDIVIPKLYGYGDAEGKPVPCGCISAVKDINYSTFTVISAYDINTGSRESEEVKAILSDAEDIYMNAGSLYIYSTVYHYDEGYSFSRQTQTQILKYSVDGIKTEFVAECKVDGYIDSQYSLDEHNGYLRVAATVDEYSNEDYTETNMLYVLDKDLKKVGEISGFADNEHIEAVRYFGDVAYIITYEQIDPLFIMDLSDPKNPVITGEVKISGFSTSLTPVDENTLLGIGVGTADNGYGGEMSDGTKIVLFDISDKNAPKVKDFYNMPGTDSDAVYTPKAIVRNEEKGYFAIPLNACDSWDYDEENDVEVTVESEFKTGAVVIRVENDKLKVDNLEAEGLDEDQGMLERCVYVGDWLYAPASGYVNYEWDEDDDNGDEEPASSEYAGDMIFAWEVK